MKFSRIILTSLVGCFVLLGGFAASWLQFINTPLQPAAATQILNVAAGSSLNKLAYQLQATGILNNPRYFILLSHLKQQTKKIQAGEYFIAEGTKPQQLLEQLVNGQVMQHSITFIEGWTFNDVLQTLKSNSKIDHQLTDLSAEEVMAKLGKPREKAEGQFLPETYHFARGDRDIDILKRAYDAMQQKLQQLWAQRSAVTSYRSAYDALIVASLIEKESALAVEKPLIAGIILKRLQKRMLLQIDPSVIYGLGKDYRGKLTKRDLRSDTPYNTYRYYGLPPTPIALPSESSLTAALNPQNSEYFYFVAKGDGSHSFSKTLQQQRQAINKYLLKQQVNNNE